MKLPLTPHHVDVESVSMVALTEDEGGLVCKVYLQDGEHWEVRGSAAAVAWIGWTTFWKGRIPMEVKVPCAIIQKLRQSVDAPVIALVENT